MTTIKAVPCDYAHHSTDGAFSLCPTWLPRLTPSLTIVVPSPQGHEIGIFAAVVVVIIIIIIIIIIKFFFFFFFFFCVRVSSRHAV